MKRRLFSLLLLFLLGAMGWTSCEHGLEDADAPELQAARPMEGGDLDPTGPCECLDCRVFDTSHLVDPFPPLVLGQNYDFAVEVKLTSRCTAHRGDELFQWGRACAVTSEQRWIDLNMTLLGAPGQQPWDVLEIYASSGGSLINDLKRDDSGRIYVDRDATIYFRWKDGASHPDPFDAAVNSGGICIIGIMTEPYWPRPGWGGRHPARLTRL